MLVADLSSGVAGGYCTKALADGGAEVVKLEPPDGDPLRRWAIGGVADPAAGGPLFQYLSCSKQSVVVDVCDPSDLAGARRLLGAADVIVWTPGTALAARADFSPAALHAAYRRAVVVAVTPFGLGGPWADRPASDLTLQCWAGAVFSRGAPDRPPVQIGGRVADWLGGLFAAVGVLTAWQRAAVAGEGELLDVSVLESLVLTGQMYGATKQSTVPPGGRPAPERQPTRAVMIPSVERAADDWVGFMVATATMWESFCVLVEHPEWTTDERLYAYAGRALRRGELEAAIADWAGGRTAADVLAAADLLRVPAAPIGNGATVTGFDHFVARRFYVTNPGNGLLQPDVPYTLAASAARRAPEPAPALGAHGRAAGLGPCRSGSQRPERSDRSRRPVRSGRAAGGTGGQRRPLPLEGIRVADFTAFWAGPIVGHLLAMMGADVIHVESVRRPDGIRGHTVVTTADDRWWEWTPQFHGPNTNKRSLTLDMSRPEGRALARRLVAHCDVMAENYAPRVIDHWGLGWEEVRELQPGLVFLRMPAFGLDGPWRDRTGYAQNMEQCSGMAWMTGFPDGPPHVPNGMCDPLAGTHATLALLLALEHRRRTGEGMLVEVPMVGGALNVAAEQVLEYQAFGHLMVRDGNRGPAAAPQNLYRCADLEGDELGGGPPDDWVAVAVETDEQWAALCEVVGDPPDAERCRTPAGRRAAHDEIDRWLGAWCRVRSSAKVVDALWPAGVPVAPVLAPAQVQHLEQLADRGFLETVTHPVVGDQLHYGYPVRFGGGPRRLHRSPAPTLGQHNREILVGLLGITEDELQRLEAAEIIGTDLLGEHRTR